MRENYPGKHLLTPTSHQCYNFPRNECNCYTQYMLHCTYIVVWKMIILMSVIIISWRLSDLLFEWYKYKTWLRLTRQMCQHRSQLRTRRNRFSRSQSSRSSSTMRTSTINSRDRRGVDLRQSSLIKKLQVQVGANTTRSLSRKSTTED